MVIRPGRTMLDPGPGGTIRQVVIMEDPWQARLNRMRQLLPLPFLVLSAAITFTVPASAFHRWARFELGLPLVAAAALLWRRLLAERDRDVDLGEFTRLGLVTVPAGLAVATVALWLSLRLMGRA